MSIALFARTLRPLAAVAVVMSVLVPPCAAYGPKRSDHPGDDPFRTVEKARHEERVVLPGAAAGRRTLVVDLVWGAITVVGEDRADAAVVVEETVRALDAEALARARREAHLEIGTAADPNGVRIYADGPFRCERRGQGDGHCDGDDLPYVVHYEVTVRVPRDVDLELANVLAGDVRVDGVRPQRFDIRNVNGNLHLAGLAGEGAARTVNGALHATFATAPTGDCEFETVNGEVDLAFPPSLAADVEVSTLNGEAWSDFPYTSGKRPSPSARQGSRHTLRNAASIARVGGGGPELRVETVNGDIFLRRNS